MTCASTFRPERMTPTRRPRRSRPASSSAATAGRARLRRRGAPGGSGRAWRGRSRARDRAPRDRRDRGRCANVGLSGSMLPARPSASVGRTSTVTGRPAASAPVNTGDAAASAPTIERVLRHERARDDRRAGQQAAAAERDDERVEIGPLVEHLERHGAGAGDDVADGCRARRTSRRCARRRPARALRPRRRSGASTISAPSRASARAWPPARSAGRWTRAVDPELARRRRERQAVIAGRCRGDVGDGRPRSPSSRASAFAAPRILNEPVACTVSSFSQTSAPVSIRQPGRRHERRRATRGRRCAGAAARTSARRSARLT